MCLEGSELIIGATKSENPVSCIYYPIRIRGVFRICCGKLSQMGDCDAACSLGSALECPLINL